MAVRMCLTVRSRSSTAPSIRLERLVGFAADQPRRALQRHAGGEQALDHRVVEVAGDALPVLEQGQLLDLGVQAGVLDGDAGGRGQADHQLLVDVGEHLGRWSCR